MLDQPSGRQGNVRYADYFIFEWAIPIVRSRTRRTTLLPKDYQAAFRGKDYVVNGTTGIRRSDELTQFYQKDYVPINGSRYSYFNGFKKFNYDYNYEILDYNQNGQVSYTQMQGNTVVIPSYLLAIYQDYQDLWDNNLTRSTNVGSG